MKLVRSIEPNLVFFAASAALVCQPKGKSVQNNAIKVLIVDDDAMCRNALSNLLELEDDILVVAQAENGEIACAMANEVKPDVILMDINMPVLNGLDAAKNILRNGLDARVIMLTTFDDDEYIVKALEIGTSGYLLKDTKSTDLSAAIRIVHAGHMQLGPSIAPKVLARLVIANHVDQLRREKEELEALAYMDALTGIMNRRAIERILAADPSIYRLTIGVLVDFDDFKTVNESCGHVGGDAALKEMASRIRRSIRPTDFVGRIGGDEFVLLFPETPLAEAGIVSERVRVAICSELIDVGDAKIRVSASLGVVPLPKADQTLEQLLSLAQHLLKKSKVQGKNRVSMPD